MKKFTFIIAAMFLTTIAFAQILERPLSVKQSLSSNEKTDWYTYWEDDGSGYIGINLWTAGEKLGMRYTPAQLAEMLDANPQITKVSIGAYQYTYGGIDYNNMNFTLEIYEGGSYNTETYEYTAGTMIYTQAITGALGWTDITLTTPVDVDVTKDLMVAIVMTGNSCIIQSHSAVPTAATLGNLYYDTTESMWYDLEFWTDETMTETEVLAWGIKVYIEDEAVYVENSDMYSMFLGSATAPYTPISTLTIGETDDLVIFPAIGNNGPDATSTTADILIMAGTTEILNQADIDLSGENSLESGYFAFITETGDITLTAADLNTAGLTGTFDVCITVTYDGVDNNAANNTACLTVTRGEVPVSNCDLQALFMTSNTNPTPIAATTTLGPTDGLTLYPGVKNNGPDNASTTATVAFTLDGTEVSSQSVPLTGLNNGMTAPLTTSGQTFTAEDMNTMGLTGTFEICMSITYDGTDAVAANNTTCLTVTRTTNVEANVASFVTMYPNPASSIVTITNVENSDITIVNMIGEVVANVNNASSNQTIDISNLSNGTYFVKVDGKVFKLNVVK